jgi:hypothetical protein
MKKLSPVLALSLITLSACGGGATGPNPNPAAPAAGKVITWSGTALRTTRTQAGVLDSNIRWEITNLTWVEDDGEVSGLGTDVLYKIGSGHVVQTIEQRTGTCVAVGRSEFDLRPSDGKLVVGPTRYSGSINQRTEAPISVIADCGFGAAAVTLTDTLELPIDSAVDTTRSASRLRGTQTVTAAFSTLTASWDLTATAWAR